MIFRSCFGLSDSSTQCRTSCPSEAILSPGPQTLCCLGGMAMSARNPQVYPLIERPPLALPNRRSTDESFLGGSNKRAATAPPIPRPASSMMVEIRRNYAHRLALEDDTNPVTTNGAVH
jgi:hypothetical protein